jgi:hypothetical protein
MTDLNEVVAAIRDASPDAPLRRRMGTVSVINANRTINVTIAGSTTAITGVHYFGHYAPKVGAQVWLDTDGRDWVAVGAIAGAGGAVPSVKVYRTADLSVANGTTYTTVTWQASESDPYGMWTTGTNVFAPITGRYLITAEIWFANNSTGYRTGAFSVNGSGTFSTFIQWNSGAGGNEIQHMTMLRNLTAGDYVNLRVRQTSGAALILNGSANETKMTMTYLGPDT